MSNEAQKADAYVHLLHELTAVIRDDVGMGEMLAMQFADVICCGLARRNPGTHVYIPSVSSQERDALELAIAAEFNGRNIDAVCRRFGVSRSTVYRACAGRK